MKIDFRKPILTVLDAPMSRSDSDNTPVDLSWVAVTSLLSDSSEPQDAKVKSFALAQRIVKATDVVDLTPEEVIVVRDAIARSFKNVTVVARSVELLNG